MSTNHKTPSCRTHQMQLRHIRIMANARDMEKSGKTAKDQTTTGRSLVKKARKSCPSIHRDRKVDDKGKENTPCVAELNARRLLLGYRGIVLNNLHYLNDETKEELNKLEQSFAVLRLEQPDLVTRLPLADITSVEFANVIPNQDCIVSNDSKNLTSKPSGSEIREGSENVNASKTNLTNKDQPPISRPSILNCSGAYNSHINKRKQNLTFNCCLKAKLVNKSIICDVTNKQVDSNLTSHENNWKDCRKHCSEETPVNSGKTLTHPIIPLGPKFVVAGQASIPINPGFYGKNLLKSTKTVTDNDQVTSTVQESVIARNTPITNINSTPVTSIVLDSGISRTTDVVNEDCLRERHYIAPTQNCFNARTEKIESMDTMELVQDTDSIQMNGNLDILATIACNKNANCSTASNQPSNSSSTLVNVECSSLIDTNDTEVESTNVAKSSCSTLPINSTVGINLLPPNQPLQKISFYSSSNLNRKQVALTTSAFDNSHCFRPNTFVCLPSSTSVDKSRVVLPSNNLSILDANEIIAQANILNHKALKQCENCGKYSWSAYKTFYCGMCIQRFCQNPNPKKLCSYGRDTYKVNNDLKLGLLVKITLRFDKQPAVDALKNAKSGDFLFYRCQEQHCPGYVDSSPKRVVEHTLLQHHRGRGNSLTPMPFYCDLCSLVLADHRSLLQHLPHCVASERSRKAAFSYSR